MSDPKHLQFVDANILIYAHDTSAGDKRCRAQELIQRLWESREGCLSIQVLQEFYVNVTQKLPKPLTSEAAAGIIADLSAWQVHSPTTESVLDAIRVQQEHHVSFWDAMVITSAQRLGCQTLWSEDLQPDRAFGELTVRSPF